MNNKTARAFVIAWQVCGEPTGASLLMRALGYPYSPEKCVRAYHHLLGKKVFLRKPKKTAL